MGIGIGVSTGIVCSRFSRLRLLPSLALVAMVWTLGACSSVGSGGGLWNVEVPVGASTDLGSSGLAASVSDSGSRAISGSAIRAGHDNTPETINVVPRRGLHCLDVAASDLSHTVQRLAGHYGMRLEWKPEEDRRIVQPYKLRFDCFEEALQQLLLMNRPLVADIYYPNRVVVVRDADRHTKVDKTALRCSTSPVRLERALPACQGEQRTSRRAAATDVAPLSRRDQRRERAERRRAERAEQAQSQPSKRSRRNRWAVRVAVYDSDAGAQRMLQRLRSDNFTSYLSQVQSGSRVFSGLYVGRDMSKRQADRMSKALDRRYGLATLAVQRSDDPTPTKSPDAGADADKSK